MKTSDRSVDFGFEKVPWAQKAERVRAVFSSVAGKYDVMNDLMSFGVHRLWKRFTLSLTGLKAGQRALDVAGGTGDLALGLARQVGKTGRGHPLGHQSADARSRPRPADRLGIRRQRRVCARRTPSACPVADDSFDCVTIGFGLRNVTDKAAALASMHRVLKPGGQLLVLEFSKPVAPGLKPLYDAYSFNVLPRLGEWVAKDAASYRYLAESIRMHPDQEALLAMLDGSRVRANPISQSLGRHRRRPPRVQDLTCRQLPFGWRPSSPLLNRGIDESIRASAVAAPAEPDLDRSSASRGSRRIRIAVCARPPRARERRRRAREPDAVIAGSPLALLELGGAARAGGAVGAEPPPSACEITGDAEIAARYRDLLELARPDWEEELSRLIGDLPARRLSRAARAALSWARRFARTAGANVAEYLQEESRDLVSQARGRGVPARKSMSCGRQPTASRRASRGSSGRLRGLGVTRLRVAARLLEIHRALVRHGLDDFVRATHLYRPFRFLFYLSPWTWFQRSAGATRGERLRLALEELGPIFVKFGQAVSTRRDLLPVDIADELAKLQDRVPPFESAAAVGDHRAGIRPAARRDLRDLRGGPARRRLHRPGACGDLEQRRGGRGQDIAPRHARGDRARSGSAGRPRRARRRVLGGRAAAAAPRAGERVPQDHSR